MKCVPPVFSNATNAPLEKPLEFCVAGSDIQSAQECATGAGVFLAVHK